MGSFKLKLVDLRLEPIVLFTNLGNFKLELVNLLLEPAVLFANLGKLASSFTQLFGGLVPILLNFPHKGFPLGRPLLQLGHLFGVGFSGLLQLCNFLPHRDELALQLDGVLKFVV